MSTDKFEIPACNSTINFSVNGTYSRAKLEDDAWVFTNLVLNDSISRQEMNLTVSARDSNITITSYTKTSSSFSNSPASSARLRYVAVGQGSQTFNLHLNPQEGAYSVVSDGVFIGLYDGWTVSSDFIITITGKGQNVSISYYGVPQTYANFLSQSFYQQHSLLIVTSMILTVTVGLAIWFRVRNRKQENELGPQPRHPIKEAPNIEA